MNFIKKTILPLSFVFMTDLIKKNNINPLLQLTVNFL